MTSDALTSITIFCVIPAGVRGAEGPRILTSPCQGEVATRRLRAAGEGPNSKFFAASLFCVIVSAAKDLDGRSDARRQQRTPLIQRPPRKRAENRGDEGAGLKA